MNDTKCCCVKVHFSERFQGLNILEKEYTHPNKYWLGFKNGMFWVRSLNCKRFASIIVKSSWNQKKTMEKVHEKCTHKITRGKKYKTFIMKYGILTLQRREDLAYNCVLQRKL